MRIRLKNQTGQVAIFVLMMFSLIFMLFGMAINVAMLVHHKINLQNAADMAALSGAAEQARILNMISWKNYELRKNFKDFMYRYWIQFNDYHPLFPDPRSPKRIGNLALKGKWTQYAVDGRQVAPSYCPGEAFGKDLITCEITRKNEISEKIVEPPLPLLFSTVEPVSAALLMVTYQNAIQGTTAAQKKWIDYGWRSFKDAWADTKAYWKRANAIYNTYLNPNFSHTLPTMLNQSGDIEERPQAWENFAKEYIENQDPLETTLNYTSRFNELPTNFDLLAQKTALNNLNKSLRQGFEFNPIRPDGNHPYIDVEPIKIDFTVFYTTFRPSRGYIVPDRHNPIDAKDFIVGVTKRPAPMTFYALMLKSKPELPFLPRSLPWELTAVAAAKPFGGRIGPRFREDDYAVRMPPTMGSGHRIRYPYLPILRVDEKRSIDDTQLLHDLKVANIPFENPEGRSDRLQPFLSPNQWDAKRYVFPDVTTSKGLIHPTDQPTQWGNLGSYPAATAPLLTSWGPDGTNRAGYSMQLVRIQDILRYIDPIYLRYLNTIEH